MELKPGYKHTELGLLPEAWEVVELGEVGRFKKGKGVKKDEAQSGQLPCVRYGELYTLHDNLVHQVKSRISPAVAAEAESIDFGDVLFAGSGETKSEIGKCAAYVVDEPGYAGGDIVILTSHGQNPHFLGYLLNMPQVQSQKASLGQGDAVVHIHASHLSTLKFPLPPLEEQEAIAEVLGDVDAQIRANEQLIEKLTNEKEGLSTQLLNGTIRLNGADATKRKHTELGLLPEDWEIVELGAIGDCIRGVSFKPHQSSTNERLDTVPLLRANNIQEGQILMKDIYYVDEDCVSRDQFLRSGDIVICAANGSRRLVGKAALYSEEISSCFGAFMAVFRTISSHSVHRYVSCFFQGHLYREQLEIVLEGSTLNNLSGRDILSLKIPQPSRREQEAIAEVLGDVDAQIAAAKKLSVKLKAKKSGLMQSLLTGKIRLA